MHKMMVAAFDSTLCQDIKQRLNAGGLYPKHHLAGYQSVIGFCEYARSSTERVHSFNSIKGALERQSKHIINAI
jgi:hypothetical protein